MPIQKLFISYSRSDTVMALKLASQLRNTGLAVWLDQLDIPPGAVWDMEIEKSLEACDCLIFMASGISVASENVLNEVYYALEEKKKVIPVKINECKIPFRIKRLQFIDLSINYDQGFNQLLKAIKQESNSDLGGHMAANEKKPVDLPDTNEDAYWQQAVKEHTVQGYEKYLLNYAGGKFSSKASGHIRRILSGEKHNSSWIYISAGAFGLSLLVAFVFMYFGQSLIGSDKSIVYFLILIPLAVCAAAFLFRAMKSYSGSIGKNFDYHTVAGPVLIFFLVVGGGYWFYQHPPQLQLFDLSVTFKDEQAPSKLLNGYVTIRYGTETGSYEIKNGEAIFKQVEYGKPIEINPSITGYYEKGNSAYTVPKPGMPLSVSVTEDNAVAMRKKMLHSSISTSLNAYLNDAKDFRRILEDSTFILNKNDAAFDSLVGTISRYNSSYLMLNIVKDSLNQANRSLLAVDADDLDKIFKSFEYVHKGLFLRFNDQIRPDLMTYVNAVKPTSELRSAIVGNIRDCILKTRDDMFILETLIPKIQKNLNF